jgi:hypothetical protein
MAVVNRKIDLLLKQMQEMKESKIMNTTLVQLIGKVENHTESTNS